MAQANRSIEIGTGLFVLLGFAALGFLTTQLPGSGLQLSRAAQNYAVVAKFDDIGSLKVGAPVTMAGVRVGQVDSIGYDNSVYKAAVKIGIDHRFDHIPDDSDAAIQTSGLLGAQYIAISPGGSETYLHAGSELQFTQSAIVLETLINKFFANYSGNKDSNANKDSGDTKDSDGNKDAGNGNKGNDKKSK
ncbi:MAG TPA: outer membrane lipid asymmetry maintenance protein MlaD [Steroidobacteraceae bacterium]|jgi:phospholipid/cholesterol/gamma-HCH transport system substrate-binding protein